MWSSTEFWNRLVVSLSDLSLCMRKATIRVSDPRSNTSWPVQIQKQGRSLKFQIFEEERLYYLYSKNKQADQLCSYRTADLHLCFCIVHIVGFLMQRLISYVFVSVFASMFVSVCLCCLVGLMPEMVTWGQLFKTNDIVS